MDHVTFTDAQAIHACAVVQKLMQERRFFLYQQLSERKDEADHQYTIDLNVFPAAIELDHAIWSAYASVRATAEANIAQFENKLNIAPPNLGGNKQLVQCNRYTGGLDICHVFPLTAFLRHAPTVFDVLFEDLRLHYMPDSNYARRQSDHIMKLARTIWAELEELRGDTDDIRCVVMMRTRFSCEDSDDNRDFMQGRVADMQEFPHAMGYLFHKYTTAECSLVNNSYVVFSTSRESHVQAHTWRDTAPGISYDARGGYSCPVLFVTTL